MISTAKMGVLGSNPRMGSLSVSGVISQGVKLDEWMLYLGNRESSPLKELAHGTVIDVSQWITLWGTIPFMGCGFDSHHRLSVGLVWSDASHARGKCRSTIRTHQTGNDDG